VTNHSQLNGGTQRKEKKPLSNLLLVSADTGAREMLQSLGLLCIVSLLLALLSLGKRNGVIATNSDFRIQTSKKPMP